MKATGRPQRRISAKTPRFWNRNQTTFNSAFEKRARREERGGEGGGRATNTHQWEAQEEKKKKPIIRVAKASAGGRLRGVR